MKESAAPIPTKKPYHITWHVPKFQRWVTVHCDLINLRWLTRWNICVMKRPVRIKVKETGKTYQVNNGTELANLDLFSNTLSDRKPPLPTTKKS